MLRYWVIVVGLSFLTQAVLALTKSGWNAAIVTTAIALAFLLGEDA